GSRCAPSRRGRACWGYWSCLRGLPGRPTSSCPRGGARRSGNGSPRAFPPCAPCWRSKNRPPERVSVREAAEEAVVLPGRPPGAVRHALGQVEDEAVEARRGLQVDRLVQVVRGGVVARVDPLLLQLLLRRPRLRA